MFIWVVVRRLLALLIRLLLLNRIVTIGVFALLFVGLIGYPLASGFMAPASGGDQGSVTASDTKPAVPAVRAASASADAPQAVQDYIRGMTNFDAKLMWNALSADAVSQMQSKGGSLDKLQQGLDEMKRSGARYEEVSYIGNYPLRDGTHYFFYVMSRRGFSGPNAVDQVYFVFTIGPDGKILRIE
jgi:hypothetical protein